MVTVLASGAAHAHVHVVAQRASVDGLAWKNPDLEPYEQIALQLAGRAQP
ncbi:hypothetical protein [Streptomyces sp. IB2014 016-6]|nr:hypothetical protein [Streptomyces sp. IB2014 016-6]